MKKIETAILVLATMSENAHQPDSALKYSQAALNLQHVLSIQVSMKLAGQTPT